MHGLLTEADLLRELPRFKKNPTTIQPFPDAMPTVENTAVAVGEPAGDSTAVGASGKGRKAPTGASLEKENPPLKTEVTLNGDSP